MAFLLFPPDFTLLQNILRQHQRSLTWEMCGGKADDEAPSRETPLSFFVVSCFCQICKIHSLFLSQVNQVQDRKTQGIVGKHKLD